MDRERQACSKTNKCEECKGEQCPYSVQWMSNDELANTLLSRTTFLGIIIRSEEEVLPGKIHNQFILSTNQQMCPKDLADILVLAAENLMKNVEA